MMPNRPLYYSQKDIIDEMNRCEHALSPYTSLDTLPLLEFCASCASQGYPPFFGRVGEKNTRKNQRKTPHSLAHRSSLAQLVPAGRLACWTHPLKHSWSIDGAGTIPVLVGAWPVHHGDRTYRNRFSEAACVSDNRNRSSEGIYPPCQSKKKTPCSIYKASSISEPCTQHKLRVTSPGLSSGR